MFTYASTSCPENAMCLRSSRSNVNRWTYMKFAFVQRATSSRRSLSMVSISKNRDTSPTVRFLNFFGKFSFVTSSLMFNTGKVPLVLLKRDMYSTQCIAVSLELKHIYLTRCERSVMVSTAPEGLNLTKWKDRSIL